MKSCARHGTSTPVQTARAATAGSGGAKKGLK